MNPFEIEIKFPFPDQSQEKKEEVLRG